VAFPAVDHLLGVFFLLVEHYFSRMFSSGMAFSLALSEQTLQRRSHSPIGESRGATCGTLGGKPILGTLFGARRDLVGDRPV